MNDNGQPVKAIGDAPDWVIKCLPLLSTVVGGGALWYTWFKYNEMVEQAGGPWYGWIRIGFTLLIGVLCLAATVLFLFGRSSAWDVFKTGLFLVPVMLVANLVILVIRAIVSVVQGEAGPFFDKLFDSPQNIIIPVIVIALVTLGVMSKKDENKNSQ
ncbi:hypothetical protein [Paenibacillus arenilitoris]|uniref:Uncharacterized protein n=1 Tax=Paenibacillus arenilitoris TaxID=2772299 RepID=A0A927H871_9BACL|nr:hypothetical protein [Paenibacillus arenilitoris]MBD2871383.1 hypothetical protein [Paenibacillus arenilitoris]